MNNDLHAQLQAVFDITTDCAVFFEESQYAIDDLSLGDYFLHIIHLRQLCSDGIQNIDTQPHSTTQDAGNKFKIMQALFHSAENILQLVAGNHVPDSKLAYMLSLIEQEARLQGQIMGHSHQHSWGVPNSLGQNILQ